MIKHCISLEGGGGYVPLVPPTSTVLHNFNDQNTVLRFASSWHCAIFFQGLVMNMIILCMLVIHYTHRSTLHVTTVKKCYCIIFTNIFPNCCCVATYPQSHCLWQELRISLLYYQSDNHWYCCSFDVIKFSFSSYRFLGGDLMLPCWFIWCSIVNQYVVVIRAVSWLLHKDRIW